MVATGDAARDDALDALVPAPSGDDDDPLPVIVRLHLRQGLCRKARLSLATARVDLLEPQRERPGLKRVIRHQEVEGHLRLTHAASGVQAWYERERQQVRADPREVRAGRRRELDDAGPIRGSHAADAVGNEGAVLSLEEHHVGDGAQGGDLGVAPPELRLTQSAPQNLEELEGDARTRKFARGAVRLELGVGDGNAFGHELGRLVVVGHHDVDPLGQQPVHLDSGRDAVVDGHDEIRTVA